MVSLVQSDLIQRLGGVDFEIFWDFQQQQKSGCNFVAS